MSDNGSNSNHRSIRSNGDYSPEEPDILFDEELEPLAVRRRDFLKLLGGGVVILYNTGSLTGAPQSRQGRMYPEDFNAYLLVKEDGRVDCYTGKIEMGQGILTSLAQMLAEELDVPLDRIDMVMGDTDLCPYDRGTFGSLTTEFFGPPLREAGAKARAVLLEIAAQHFKTKTSLLAVKDGVVFIKNKSGKKISYAQLTRGKKIIRSVAVKPSIKHPSKHTVSGKSPVRLDALEKVTGEARFAGDIRLPGLLVARILRPPVHGATLKSVDLSEAEKVKGIKLVRAGDFIAVLHRRRPDADRALALIKAEFQSPKSEVDNRTIFKHLLNTKADPRVVEQSGDLEAAKKLATKKIKEDYFNQYVAHAPLEPHSATVSVEGNRAKVWASTQTPFRAKEEVARALEIPSKNVRVLPTFVGGGFGGKTRNPQAVEAARLSKLTGKPVQVAWSRKEEFFYDTFRPAAVIRIDAGTDDSGKILYWHYDNYFAGSRSSQPIYDIPHLKVLTRGSRRGGDSPHPFGVGAWRGPGSNTNCFAMESHIDMLAQKAGIDPLTFRLRNIKDKRMLKALKKAAQMFGHSFSKGPSGKGYGIACTDYRGTMVAAMAEVRVDKTTGNVSVERIVCAQDMGEVINPDGARIQVEGCFTMGLGYVFTEQIRFRGGDVQDKNFDTYEIPRFSWTPKFEVAFTGQPGELPQACGEPAITATGGLLANAIYDAIGVRFFELPITPEQIKTALKNKPGQS